MISRDQRVKAGKSGREPSGNHQEQAPAIEKGRHAAKAIANEDVEAAASGLAAASSAW